MILEWACEEEQLALWLEDPNRDIQTVEALFNHIHLWDIFKPTEESEEEFLVYLL